MANLILKNPLIFQDGVGVSIDPTDTELFAIQRRTVIFTIGQAVGSGSSVVFSQLTGSKVQVDSGSNSLILSGNTISGSFTHTGDLSISSYFSCSNDLTINGLLVADEFRAELTQSVTLFRSGSTQFGDTIDDIHTRTGSMATTGSLSLNNGTAMLEISDDITLADLSVTSLITENAIKNYTDNNTSDFQTYARKSFAHTGSFVSVSTASFTAATASAPTGYTGTSEEDFMFFINGMIMEHDSLNVQQNDSSFLLKVDNSTIGYNLEVDDEFVAFGKFNS